MQRPHSQALLDGGKTAAVAMHAMGPARPEVGLTQGREAHILDFYPKTAHATCHFMPAHVLVVGFACWARRREWKGSSGCAVQESLRTGVAYFLGCGMLGSICLQECYSGQAPWMESVWRVLFVWNYLFTL